MKRFSKLIIIILSFLVVLSTPFSYASAQNSSTPALPAPTDMWVQAWDASSGQYLIKLRENVGNSKFPYEFQQSSPTGKLYDRWGATQLDNILTSDAIVWHNIKSTPPMYAITSNSNSTSDKQYVFALCRLGEINETRFTKLRMLYSSQNIALGGLWGIPEDQIYSCLLRRAGNQGQTDITLGNEWTSIVLPSLTDYSADTKNMISTAWPTIRDDKNDIFKKGRQGTEPKAENVTACKAKGIDPLFYNNPNAEAEFKKGLEDMHQKLIANPGNEAAKSYIDAYFNNQDLIKKLFNDLYEEDLKIYNIFYGDHNKDYPTVPPSMGLYEQTLAYYHELQQALPVENRGLWDNTTMKLIVGVPVTVLASTGVGAVLTFASGVGSMMAYGATMEGIDKYYNASSFNNEVFFRLYKFILANTYLLANEQFNECLASKGDPYAMPNAELSQMLKSLAKSAEVIGGGIDSKEGQTVCDKIKDNFIMAGIGQAVCGFTILFKKWANSYICIAQNYLNASLGIKQGGTTDPTADTESACANIDYGDITTDRPPAVPSGGTPTPIANPATPTSTANIDDIKTQAVSLCNTKKSTTATAEWAKGQCLIENLNSSGYSVDVAHSPRQTIDNSNVCSGPQTGGKYIELNVNDCSIIEVNNGSN